MVSCDEVILGQRLDKLLPLNLVLVLGQGQVHQLPLQCGEEEKSAGTRLGGGG